MEEFLEVWKRIAPSFGRVRNRPWRYVLEWIERNVPPGSTLLDVGCGNGRQSHPWTSASWVVGVDFSLELLRMARTRGLSVVQGDARFLPIQDSSIDGALLVALLHGIPERESRLRVLSETRRALKPGSPALVTVWYRRRGEIDPPRGKTYVPWGGVLRPTYFYTKEELHKDVEETGFTVVSMEEFGEGEGPEAPGNLALFARA